MGALRAPEDHEPRREISTNCRRAKGEPNRRHVCTGCDCPCHHVTPPEDFRALFEQAKEEAR